MADISIKKLLESGVHFGHQTQRWNPKMKKYIFGERNGIYIINLEITIQCFQKALAFIVVSLFIFMGCLYSVDFSVGCVPSIVYLITEFLSSAFRPTEISLRKILAFVVN